MSDYLAVGGISAVLRSLLASALTNGGPTSILTTVPAISATSPDLVPTGKDETARVNLFMYYASLNPALRNLNLPSRNSAGNRMNNEPLALNLHYLVTAYGSQQFDPEILLGWVMKVFHDTPVVPRATIQAALADLTSGTQVTPEAQLVATSTLANQVEHIRITPETLTTEEIYRLWTAFQTHYRPTTSYQVSVIVIQDTQAFKSGPPVLQRTVSVMPLNAPVIDSINPSAAAAGDVLTINGRNFIGDSPLDTSVSFDGAAGVAPAVVQSEFLRVAVPNTLQAGTRTLRIVRTITYPLTPTPHAGFSSGPTPFQLLPVIKNAIPISVTRGTGFDLSVMPAVGSTQRATLYIGDTAIPIDERSAAGPASSTTLAFPIPADLTPGSYPLRVEIDGAQSRITVDDVSGSSTFGQLIPQIRVSA